MVESSSRGNVTRPAPLDQASAAALNQLVAEGTLSEQQAARVAEVFAGTRPTASPDEATGTRSRLAEIAGYLGSALLLGAGALFLTNGWDDLGEATRVLILTGLAVALLGAGWFVAVSAGQPVRELRDRRDSARRRLVSVLWTSAAASAGSAAGLGAPSWELVAGSALGVVVAAVGYAVVPGVVGQLGLWVGSMMLATGLVGQVGHEPGASAYGVALVALGAAWVVLGLTGTVRDREVALATGAGIALFGAQLPVFDGDNHWLAYALTALVATAGFAGYLSTRSWSVLGAGVLATTLVVPEALHDWTDGSVSAAGSLLVAGLTLLAASAVGLRLRQEVRQPDREGDSVR